MCHLTHYISNLFTQRVRYQSMGNKTVKNELLFDKMNIDFTAFDIFLG